MATKVGGWDKLVAEAKRLQGQSGLNAFERAVILQKLRDDTVGRSRNGLDKPKALFKYLDEFCADLCVKSSQLLQILDHFPNRDKWSTGDLRTMLATVLAANQPTRKVRKTRDSVTVAEAVKLRTDLEHQRKLVASLESQLQAALTKVATLEAENAELKGRLAESRRINPRRRAAA